MPAQLEIKSEDLKRASVGLRHMARGEMRNASRKSLVNSAGSVAKTTMRDVIRSQQQGKSPKRPASMGPPKRGQKGPLAVSVRPKLLKPRGRTNELVAVGVGPRAWYKAWFIKGTRPHSLAKGAKRKTGKLQSVGLQHPGAKPHDVVGETEKRVAARVGASLAQDVLAEFVKQVGKTP